jgi:hypothetical protein
VALCLAPIKPVFDKAVDFHRIIEAFLKEKSIHITTAPHFVWLDSAEFEPKVL